jgi:hypothetical protein
VLKVYDKAGRVLRVEVKVLNTAGLGYGKGLGKLDHHYLTLRAELQRTCQALGLAA